MSIDKFLTVCSLIAKAAAELAQTVVCFVLFQDFRLLTRVMIGEGLSASGYIRPSLRPAIEIAADLCGYDTEVYGSRYGEDRRYLVVLTRKTGETVTTYTSKGASYLGYMQGPTLLAMRVLVDKNATYDVAKAVGVYGMQVTVKSTDEEAGTCVCVVSPPAHAYFVGT